MVKNIAGASNVTEYQLEKFSRLNGVENDEILNLYIKYSREYNVQVDVAYMMCLIYTDFFKKEIDFNNIVGIGPQKGGTKFETFFSIEQCIIAHCQILQKISSDIIIDSELSNLYRRVDSSSCTTSLDVYNLFGYADITKYSIYEFSTFIRELNRTRKDEEEVPDSSDIYYYIKLKSSTRKQEIIKLRSSLINQKFNPTSIFVVADRGVYSLEIGRYSTPTNINKLLNNLKVFGYNGEIKFRRKPQESKNV